MNLRFLTNAIFLLAATAAMAQQTMTVHMKDGQQFTYNIEDVEYVEMQAPTMSDDAPKAEIIGGVVGTPVDLGLSVMWADHNFGGTLPSDEGVPCTWSYAKTYASKWGEGWRVPTEEEWQELYTKCKWSWEVRDGVGGRLITAENGNSIFIPASGVLFDNKVNIRGCIGIYWTAGEEESTLPDMPVNAIGTYFDSANIYRINYPRSNTFSVRLVK